MTRLAGCLMTAAIAIWRHGMRSLDDPASAEAFRFRMGELVSTPRGEGSIGWGGTARSLIEYDIERADGFTFSVQEHDVLRQ